MLYDKLAIDVCHHRACLGGLVTPRSVVIVAAVFHERHKCTHLSPSEEKFCSPLASPVPSDIAAEVGIVVPSRVKYVPKSSLETGEAGILVAYPTAEHDVFGGVLEITSEAEAKAIYWS
jgi:hypothetical protein